MHPSRQEMIQNYQPTEKKRRVESEKEYQNKEPQRGNWRKNNRPPPSKQRPIEDYFMKEMLQDPWAALKK